MTVLPLTQYSQLALYRTCCLTDILLREHVLLCVNTPQKHRHFLPFYEHFKVLHWKREMGRTKSEINDLICKQVFMLALCVTKKMGTLGDGISCDVANIELI